MGKTVTIRLTDDDYRKILASAQADDRPISNYITHVTLKTIEDSLEIDPMEMEQILKDHHLQSKLKRGHAEARKKNGRFAV
jgi:hypothetical protein